MLNESILAQLLDELRVSQECRNNVIAWKCLSHFYNGDAPPSEILKVMIERLCADNRMLINDLREKLEKEPPQKMILASTTYIPK